jgi:hypothetical protein
MSTPVINLNSSPAKWFEVPALMACLPRALATAAGKLWSWHVGVMGVRLAGMLTASGHDHTACTARKEKRGQHLGGVRRDAFGPSTGPRLSNFYRVDIESRRGEGPVSLWMTADNRLSLQQPGRRLEIAFSTIDRARDGRARCQATRRKDRYQPRAASASQPKTLKTYACARDCRLKSHLRLNYFGRFAVFCAPPPRHLQLRV